MPIIKWNSSDITNLTDVGIEEIWTEIDINGSISREIGFDDRGVTVHKFPSEMKFGKFGIFDGSIINTDSNVEEMDLEIFNMKWRC